MFFLNIKITNQILKFILSHLLKLVVPTAYYMLEREPIGINNLNNILDIKRL